MAEMMYLVRYYCDGVYYREEVPEYDLKRMKNMLNHPAADCVFISETKIGINPQVERPLYFNCVPYCLPGRNAVVDDPSDRTRIEQIREKNPEELAEFLLSFSTRSAPASMVEWLLSTGPLQTEVSEEFNREAAVEATQSVKQS